MKSDYGGSGGAQDAIRSDHTKVPVLSLQPLTGCQPYATWIQLSLTPSSLIQQYSGIESQSSPRLQSIAPTECPYSLNPCYRIEEPKLS